MHYLHVNLSFLAIIEQGFVFCFFFGMAVKIITDKKTGQSLGFAYVWFSNEEFAQRAIEELNGKVFIFVEDLFYWLSGCQKSETICFFFSFNTWNGFAV